MNKKIISLQDLVKCDWQYQARPTSVNDFKIGDLVFISCDKECRLLRVIGFEGQELIVWAYWKKEIWNLPFVAAIHIKTASLLVYKDKYKVCLN